MLHQRLTGTTMEPLKVHKLTYHPASLCMLSA